MLLCGSGALGTATPFSVWPSEAAPVLRIERARPCAGAATGLGATIPASAELTPEDVLMGIGTPGAIGTRWREWLMLPAMIATHAAMPAAEAKARRGSPKSRAGLWAEAPASRAAMRARVAIVVRAVMAKAEPRQVRAVVRRVARRRVASPTATARLENNDAATETQEVSQRAERS